MLTAAVIALLDLTNLPSANVQCWLYKVSLSVKREDTHDFWLRSHSIYVSSQCYTSLFIRKPKTATFLSGKMIFKLTSIICVIHAAIQQDQKGFFSHHQLLTYCDIKSPGRPPVRRGTSPLFMVAVEELLIVSHDLRQQIKFTQKSWDCSSFHIFWALGTSRLQQLKIWGSKLILTLESLVEI